MIEDWVALGRLVHKLAGHKRDFFMTDDGQALGWIVAVLRRADVPFQFVGGLAARAYGATRPLADLDFYIPTSRLNDIAGATAAYASRLPSPHRDECWDLTFMKLDYLGQPIEIGGSDGARYFDRQAGLWREAGICFDASVERTLFGIRLPVMPLGQLIEYKQRLDRDVDRQDVAEIVVGGERGAGEPAAAAAERWASGCGVGIECAARG